MPQKIGPKCASRFAETTIWLCVAISAALTLTGCSLNTTSTGPEQHESRSVNLDKSEKVRVALKMGTGELDVQGGAKQLMDGEFTYNVPSWKPEIRYQSSATGGDLVIEQPGPSSSTGNTKIIGICV